MNTYSINTPQLAEDFINTYDLYLEQPEHLRTPDDLRRFLDSHGFELASGDRFTPQTLEMARELRAQLRGCWTSNSAETMAQALNPLLRQAYVLAQVEPDAGGLSLQFVVTEDSTLMQRLAVTCARGMIALAQQHGIDRMRSCSAEPCRDVFVDTSRNKSRRFCSERCANRYNIAAFRDRQKQGDGEGE